MLRSRHSRLSGYFPTSCSIGKPLALDAFQRAIGAFQIVNAERDPIIVPEIKLRGVPMQMGFADVEITPVDAAFEDAEKILDRVGMPEVGANIFLGRVVNGSVTGELCANARIDSVAIGHQVAGLIDVADADWLQGLRGYVRDAEAADLPSRSTSERTM